MRVSHDKEQDLIEQVLTKMGATSQNAALQAKWLVEADLRSQNSHGIRRLPILAARIANGLIDPVAHGNWTWQSDGVLLVDGERGFGPVVAVRAIEAILDRAERTGIAVAAIHNSNHVGVLAPYAEMIADKGQVAIAATTSEALVHPWGGRVAMIGTNPLAVGVPTANRPLVIDLATGVVSMGLVLHRAETGGRLEEGWALDAEGDPTTDPVSAASGAITPFGAHKGYALGLALEVMVATLTSCALGRDVRGTLDAEDICNKGDLFICIKPGQGPAGSTMSAVSQYLEEVQACPAQSGFGTVLLPGEPEQRKKAASLAQGYEIADPIWDAALGLLAES